jgi:hypothetical protein
VEIRYSRSLPTYVKVRSGIVYSRSDCIAAGASLYRGEQLMGAEYPRAPGVALAFELYPGHEPSLTVLRTMMDLNEDEYEEGGHAGMKLHLYSLWHKRAALQGLSADTHIRQFSREDRVPWMHT